MKDKKLIGHISVDSGTVWVGDPCYIIHTEKLPKTLGKDWLDLCLITDGSGEPEPPHLPMSFNHDNGQNGLGVMSYTKIGDGYYPVYMIGNNDGIYIDFLDTGWFGINYEDDEEQTLQEKVNENLDELIRCNDWSVDSVKEHIEDLIEDMCMSGMGRLKEIGQCYEVWLDNRNKDEDDDNNE